MMYHHGLVKFRPGTGGERVNTMEPVLSDVITALKKWDTNVSLRLKGRNKYGGSQFFINN
jgi:hypothetical protein